MYILAFFLFSLLFLFLLSVLIQLVRVYNVVPYTVEAAGNGSDGGEERVAHPDGKHRVLLAERLSARYPVVIYAAHLASEPELQQTAYQRRGNEAQFCRQRHVGMHYGARRNGHRQRQRHCPKIKAEFAEV